MANMGVILAEQTSRFMQAVDLVVTETRAKVTQNPVETPDDFKQLMGSEAVHLFLKSQLTSLPQADALSIASADGKIVNFSRSYPVPNIDISDRDYFQYFRDHGDAGAYISEPVINRGTGTWTFYLVRRINGRDGRMLGLALGAIEVRYLQDFYKAITLNEGGSVTLLRRDGRILVRHPDIEGLTGQSMPVRSPWYRLLDENGGTYDSPGYFDGRPRVVSVHPLKDYPLVVDVTIAEYEALAQWRQQASYIAASAGFFLANMSHELRTPLNAVIAFSEIIRDQLMGSESNRYRAYAADIHSAGQHLLDLINDILDLSKIEVGHLELTEARMRILDVAERCITLVSKRAEEGQVELVRVVPPALPDILGDERRVKQILINLLSNAVKFTPPGGQVTTLLRLTPAGELMVEIRDTGIGIRPEDIDTAMMPFRQIDGGLNRRHEGTGLGLPLARRLAEMHGGRLEIESELGRGTVVRLYLPAERVLAAASAAAHAPAAAG
jgi:signal transduction histidine kinase